jgi:hypothetical protein
VSLDECPAHVAFDDIYINNVQKNKKILIKKYVIKIKCFFYPYLGKNDV